MFINKLVCTGFRNLQDCSLELDPRMNIIVGQNGSGKSSLIEALYFLGFGRSFRTNKINNCIQHGAEEFTIHVQGQHNVLGIKQLQHIQAGITRARNSDIVCQINGDKPKKLSELVKQFPIQLFTPQSTDLVIGSPKLRRRFLDWGVFHVEHLFEKASRDFNILLKQRNALLKTESFDGQLLEVWTNKFVEASELVNQFRLNYLDTFKLVFKEVVTVFLPNIPIEIEYNSGWKIEHSLLSLLNQKLAYDRASGSTSFGAQKADLKFKTAKRDAADVLSRGQLRMLVAALLLAQTRLLNSVANSQTLFLLDDIGAELDIGKKELFLDELDKSHSQVVVTSIDKQQLNFVEKYDKKKMFHVKHGSVKEE